MNLNVLVVDTFREAENQTDGWSKSTIDYINTNRAKVTRAIRSVARGLCKQNLQLADVDDIYSEILLYLYRSDDWNVEKAIGSNSDTIVTLEGYINSCVKYCVMRYLTTQYNKDKTLIRDTVDDEGKELSIFDTISDDKATAGYDQVIYDFEQLCKANECMRYKYGPDIYLILYVRLLTIENKKDDTYRDILSVLGVSKKDLYSIERKSSEDDMLLSLTKAVVNSGVEKAVQVLEKYVYSADKIKEVIT